MNLLQSFSLTAALESLLIGNVDKLMSAVVPFWACPVGIVMVLGVSSVPATASQFLPPGRSGLAPTHFSSLHGDQHDVGWTAHGLHDPAT